MTQFSLIPVFNSGFGEKQDDDRDDCDESVRIPAAAPGPWPNKINVRIVCVSCLGF